MTEWTEYRLCDIVEINLAESIKGLEKALEEGEDAEEVEE